MHTLCINLLRYPTRVPWRDHDEKLRKFLNLLVLEHSGWASACFLTFKPSKYLWPYGPCDMLVLSTSWLFSLKSTAFIWHRIRLWNVFFISYDDPFRYQRCCLQSEVNLSTCKIGHQHLKLVTNPNCIQHPSSKWIKPFFDPAIYCNRPPIYICSLKTILHETSHNCRK